MKQIFLAFLFFGLSAGAQEKISNELTFTEFLGYVKKYHPLVKNANLEISKSQANLMMARGGFDPKIEVDFSEKQFKGSEYYSILNSSFKIPTWYGIEIKAGFDNSEGVYLNPQNTLPNQGLTSLGVTIPLGQGLFINQRMADVRKAKMQMQLSLAERKLQAIVVLYDASLAYFNWKKNFNEVALYQEYNQNAQIRFKGIQSLIIQGDKPSIDSVEAGIIVKNRKLSLEDSNLKLAKAKLELATFLWLENNIPLELSDALIPEIQLEFTIQESLKTNALLNSDFSITNHPKINALQSKIDMLNVERKLKANMLLPKIDVGYSYISEPSYIDNYQFEDYKIGLDFYFPLFLRKERGSLKLAKYKVQESEFVLDLEKVQLTNKINAQKLEIKSLLKQQELIKDLVQDNLIMLNSEERLFSFGESSLFLINIRENNLVTAQLSKIALENRFYISNSDLFKIMANPD
ncbi:transporter [Flavobacterium sp. GSP27]|uniref:TolC family protein n=1 Tax=unclassified Flavobacterium TaxID=196869 RepID=UPI000F8307C1|nr:MULTISPECIES: TolC family protein [unclassified Flavobacterium]RTY95550.1 transporter [Flavobacterium sp. GSN2]RTY71348.1 transporter [Flavobacterium sp. LB2P53]RTY76786.1 transporter [Flavobacterium sp. LS1R10]RTY83197.1 transporter [Flavobacterium sp. ZB4P23]RTY84321.1 transporter [Flavobacterium sp. LS1P28]